MASPAPMLDLLIVGGLTVDRFADGSVAPGGSVFHATRALARVASIGVITVAGDEAVAQAGLAELRMLAAVVSCSTAPRTIGFLHHETATGRRMWLEPGGAQISATDAPRNIDARAVLFAPVAEEIAADALRSWTRAPVRAAILQGWLRDVDHVGEVQSRSLVALDAELQAALGTMDLLVASPEDLRADGDDEQRLLDVLRHHFGPRSLLVLTHRDRGAWIDHRGERWHAAVSRRVEGVPTVGAGDVLAAALTLAFRRGDDASRVGRAIAEAMETTARWLESRRS